MQTSLDYLMKTIEKNPERIIFDAENIIVLGNLATYFQFRLIPFFHDSKTHLLEGVGFSQTKTTRKGELKGKL